MNTITYLSDIFSKYYLRALIDRKIPAPAEINNREFALVFWKRKGMFRHLKIENMIELKRFLDKGNSFKHLYISGAYYKYPNAEIMNRKEWLGTDFLIDIDADHLDIPCKQEHDIWYCSECRKEGKGTPPEKCPKCGSDKIKSVEWICDSCLRAAKNEVSKFLNNFVPQFNIDLRDVKVHFSGHRGYHIIISSNIFKRLRDYERREIVDFLLDPGKEQINERIRGTLNDIISLFDITSFNPLNFRKNTINDIKVNRDNILNSISLDRIVYTKNIGISKNIFNKLVLLAKKRLGLQFDVPVSIDIRRLIRLLGSLHGKTGFQVQEIPIKDLDQYDPLTSAVVFDQDKSIKVKTDIIPRFRIKDKFYGPFKRASTVELPFAVAIFVMAKGVAIKL